jgi:hypothetical protein
VCGGGGSIGGDNQELAGASSRSFGIDSRDGLAKMGLYFLAEFNFDITCEDSRGNSHVNVIEEKHI